jgi:hypothetical protein
LRGARLFFDNSAVTTLLSVTALIEVGVGLALLLFPSTTATLLVGTPLYALATLTVARVCGTALLSLGAACWLARRDTSLATRGLITAMVLYNFGVVIVLGAAGIWSKPVGVALWPAIILHGAMTAWCVVTLSVGERDGGTRCPRDLPHRP